MKATNIITHNIETTYIKPTAILKALSVFTQAQAFIQPAIKYKDTERVFKEMDKLIQHQNTFEYFNEDVDYYDFRWSNENAEEGDLDEIIFTVNDYTYMPDGYEGKEFDYEKAEHYTALSSWVTIGIKGEDYPMEYDLNDIIYTVEKCFSLEDE